MKLQHSTGLTGTITVPGDKSVSHRGGGGGGGGGGGVMLGALSDGVTHVTGFLMGEDCLSTIDCFRKMGVQIEVGADHDVTVHGVGLHGLQKPSARLYTGNSGTTTRLISGILAGQPFATTLTGDASIEKRPMGRIIRPLREMGADITGVDDKFCPLSIGPAICTASRTPCRSPRPSSKAPSCWPACTPTARRPSSSPRPRATTPSACCAPWAAGWTPTAAASRSTRPKS